MKNKLSNLNDHLFEQLERLNDDNLTAEQLDREATRGGAMVAIADQIIRNAALQLACAKLVADHKGGDPMSHLPEIEGRKLIEAPRNGKARQ